MINALRADISQSGTSADGAVSASAAPAAADADAAVDAADAADAAVAAVADAGERDLPAANVEQSEQVTSRRRRVLASFE